MRKKKKGNDRLTPQKKRNLGSRAILGDNPNFEGNCSLRCDSVRGTTRPPDIFFLDFHLFFFYIVFLLSCIYIILVI